MSNQTELSEQVRDMKRKKTTFVERKGILLAATKPLTASGFKFED